MKKMTMAMMISVVLLISLVSPVSAVTDGELDGNSHPMVVLIIADVDGAPVWRCSGTLLSSTLVLTAGHCTSNYPDSGEITGMRIFYESDIQNGNNTYPYAGGPNSIEAKEWHTHPLFETAPFVYHDVGVVILAKPLKLSQYGKLPAPDQMDAYKTERGLQDVTFTAVGYGLQQSFPDAAAWKEHNVKIRMVAYPQLLQINVPGFTGDFSLLLSNVQLFTNWRSTAPLNVTGVVLIGPKKDVSVAGPFAEMVINKLLATFLGADAGKVANLSEYKGANPPPQNFMIWTNSPGDAERVLTLELVRALDKWSSRNDPVIKLTSEGISITFAGVKLEKTEEILAVVGLGNMLLHNAG